MLDLENAARDNCIVARRALLRQAFILIKKPQRRSREIVMASTMDGNSAKRRPALGAHAALGQAMQVVPTPPAGAIQTDRTLVAPK